jgi:hypothetical protein
MIPTFASVCSLIILQGGLSLFSLSVGEVWGQKVARTVIRRTQFVYRIIASSHSSQE